MWFGLTWMTLSPVLRAHSQSSRPLITEIELHGQSWPMHMFGVWQAVNQSHLVSSPCGSGIRLVKASG